MVLSPDPYNIPVSMVGSGMYGRFETDSLFYLSIFGFRLPENKRTLLVLEVVSYSSFQVG